MAKILLDTNIILRYLRNDDAFLSPKAKKFFDLAQNGQLELYIDEIVIAEVIWVNKSVYKARPLVTLKTIQDLLSFNWIKNPRKQIILSALSLAISNPSLNYVDCWLYCLSKEENLPLQTFDQKLKHLKSPHTR
ncbi:MAG: hypothetical protein UY21_C0007G0031 [Microgenomates group bacterium GW2011_GWA1_48_10]|uniref:PIN domain-containing protein n=1 Tax=Candidatus Gottesmanbacteria bacterium RIFCSPHIGHO2_01_FULL_47_48 TaxID=1798381 RepID=A0A1F6A3Z2_9BACT|nr:MAG: hypothetical protein UY21_C0007G0031 [Microgenomates group bacterium GW2011_GWA1_48_10]OGG18977.1 MAG: hypothetical protein A2721_02450 [Candidatus Gottesmanbacteria bacterium RIFCSPHIGHO2_01_FULL_47_48]